MKESCNTIASYDPLQEESLDLALWLRGPYLLIFYAWMQEEPTA